MKYLSIIGIVVSFLSAILMGACVEELKCWPNNTDPVTGFIPFVQDWEFIWMVFIP